MKKFIKENIIYILILVLLSLLLILWSHIIRAEFQVAANFNNLETLSDRVRCANSLGWEIDKTSETKKLIYLEKTPTTEFLKFNKMQKMCGFDLLPYLGKGVTVYTYRILDFPSDNPVNAFLNIIIYNDKMIGGDCTVEEYDDLYLPVKLPQLDAHIS